MENRRGLVLVSKVIQNLSNNVMFGKKELFMEPMNEFIKENREKMMKMQRRLAVRVVCLLFVCCCLLFIFLFLRLLFI